MTDFILFTTSDRPREYTNKLIPMLSKAGYSSEAIKLYTVDYFLQGIVSRYE